jgi:nucleotide-binding universal stress UspA family protein
MARDTAPSVYRSILCPVDFSGNSRAALRYAAMLARLSDAHLFVLYVDDPLLAVAAATRPDARALVKSREVDLRRFVANTVGRTTPPVQTTLLTVAGKPDHEITQAAARHGCDLIVMGYRGIGRASRFFFGSTTEGVVRSSSVPVVAVPPARRGVRLPAAGRLRRAS